MDKKCTHPIPLETILGAEEAVFHPELEARRTLEGARIVIAVATHALTHRPHGDRKRGGVNKDAVSCSYCRGYLPGRETASVRL